MSRKVILVLYYTRGVYPLRSSVEAHLYAWRRFSRHRVVYVNVAFGFPAKRIASLDIDVVIFHTLFLGMRWTPSIFSEYSEKCRLLRSLECTKIAMPQDDFLYSDIVSRFVESFGVTHLLTPASSRDARIIYEGVDFGRVQLRTVLTGYVDTRMVRRVERDAGRFVEARPIDIGYRAWRTEHWLGEHGTKKVRIAEEVAKAAQSQGLRTDISLREEDTLVGYDWLDFLGACKATIGSEGGASLLDRDGSVRERTLRYLREHPDAPFEETRRECFPDRDGKINLFVITPRHFEAAATRTLQILVEGDYNSVLKAGIHYVSIKSDFSNVNQAISVLQDPEAIESITDRAYKQLIGSDRWTYETFVREIERDIIEKVSDRDRVLISLPCSVFASWTLRAIDWVDWLFIRFERWIIDRGLKPAPTAFLYRRLRKLRWGDF
jgi:hypothetical protein